MGLSLLFSFLCFLFCIIQVESFNSIWPWNFSFNQPPCLKYCRFICYLAVGWEILAISTEILLKILRHFPGMFANATIGAVATTKWTSTRLMVDLWPGLWSGFWPSLMFQDPWQRFFVRSAFVRPIRAALSYGRQGLRHGQQLQLWQRSAARWI